MKKITRQELIDMWFNFHKSHGHKIIDNASLIPENDASVLFTTAGMHPLVPYLLGEKHPAGKRLANNQKCIRTGDIDEVGDSTHFTFFEMLGNWSLGDYFKEEMIKWSYEFLTDKKYLGIPKEKLAVTVFAGDADVPRDEVSASAWENTGLSKDKIFFLGKKDNWWGLAAGTGPCGPDTEMFVDTGKPKCNPNCSPACKCGKYVEIWNNVFMQYKIEKPGAAPKLLDKHNVDTGMGLERTLCLINGKASAYETELFDGAIKIMEELSGKKYDGAGDENTKSFRIIADHIRSATAILGDEKGITPSNTGAGYVLRRLIRRSIRHALTLGIASGHLGDISEFFIDYFKTAYPEFYKNKKHIIDELNAEEDKFNKTISTGIKELAKVISGIEKHKEFAAKSGEKVGNIISGKAAFRLYETYGFPLELTTEMAGERGYTVDEEGFKAAYAEHQEKARAGSEQLFKGGLADSSEKTTRLHTAVHILQAGLRKYLGDTVYQKGSNITPERARFDFSFDRPMTAEEIKKVEDFVNDVINRKLPVECSEMTVNEAKKLGAIGIFESKYGDVVKVYSVKGVTSEICGGPHVKNTGELGKFKITKEQSSSSGVRRIRAELE